MDDAGIGLWLETATGIILPDARVYKPRFKY